MMKRITPMAAALCALLVIGCAGNQREINTIAARVYAEAGLEEPLPPHRFASDGCSCWPDGDWVECCVIHDLVYWMGGTREERKAADAELMHCVAAKGHLFMAKTMYVGVRAGGVWWLPTPFRWGFGWDYPHSGPENQPY